MNTSTLVRRVIDADGRVINARTGEMLELKHAAPEDLADARLAFAALKAEIDDAVVRLDSELVGRIDQAVSTGELGGYTAHIGAYEIRAPSPTAGGKLNATGLRAAALDQATELGLSHAAIVQAFDEKVTYTLRRKHWRTLTTQAPALADLLREHTGPPERRRVTVVRLESAPAPVEASVEEEKEFPW